MDSPIDKQCQSFLACFNHVVLKSRGLEINSATCSLAVKSTIFAGCLASDMVMDIRYIKSQLQN